MLMSGVAMSSISEGNSFGSSNDSKTPAHQPPTPSQTPTSAAFPSPVFQTPKQNQGQFSDSGNWTPRFAEDYSVFNSTPGNLTGSDGPFADFVPATPTSSGDQRLLSTEGFATEIATHANHFSENPDRPLPPVDPSRRLSSSPRAPHSFPIQDGSEAQSSPQLQKSKTPSRSRRSQNQVATPPPTTHKGTRNLSLATTMQNDESFGQADFSSDGQHQDMTMMMNPNDLFSYPMSAPVTGPTSFWDPSSSMAMDMDFMAAANMFHTTGPSQQTIGSFDWTQDLNMLPNPNMSQPQQIPPPSSQETDPPPRRERPLAPKPPAQPEAAPPQSAEESFAGEPVNAFGIVAPGDGVNPGLLSRPQTAVDTSFGMSGLNVGDKQGPASSMRERNGKLPDRAFASSPVKPLSRPRLGRSMSENRGKKSRGRTASAGSGVPGRPLSMASGSELEGSRPIQRTGRTSPLKKQHRLSGLASIPEIHTQKPRSRASVRFTIDSMGRARAETTVVPDDEPGPSVTRGRSTEDLSRTQDWPSEEEEDEDESSTDDEPIIIPNRGSSNHSFALPDPRKPVGSIFHTARRSVSERSTSTQGTMEGLNGHLLDVESEAETVLNDQQMQGMDAQSELRRVAEQRQKRGSLGQVPRYSASFGGAISPTSLTDSTDGGIRCVCHRNRGDESLGYMVQCESCEMWLHGKCINITKRSMPRVYICAFCANTPNMRGGRMRDTGRGAGLGIAPASSPLASRSFKSFR